MAIVQFRVEDEIKDKAGLIFEELGISLSAALRMFLKRSILCNGIPFPMVIDDLKEKEAKISVQETMDELEKEVDSDCDKLSTDKALNSLNRAQEISLKNGNSEMTLDEINAEIAKARKERRDKR